MSPDSTIQQLAQQGAVPPDDFNDSIERIREVAEDQITIPEDIADRILRVAADFAVGLDVIESCVFSLITGNLVLQGPPGTGKTSLARAICERIFNVRVVSATAHPEWSIYDVIGRQELRLDPDTKKEEIVPVNGAVVQAVIDCAGEIVKHEDGLSQHQAVWLIIDELNRCEIDRAFGELFTAIGTDELVEINLNYQRKGNSKLVIPKRFRIIGTLNTIDKRFVNDLSQALKRRFAFITVDIPSRPNDLENLVFDSQTPLGKEFDIVCSKASQRAYLRLGPTAFDIEAECRRIAPILYKLIVQVRYPSQPGMIFLPVGTAQIIDTLELFLIRYNSSSESWNNLPPNEREQQQQRILDWSTSIRLVPLFDADIIGQQELENFARSLVFPFDFYTKRELLRSALIGQSYVD